MIKKNISILLASLFLISCTGGGGSSSSPVPPQTPPVYLSGMAAEGNPLVNTSVEIRGSNGLTAVTTTDLNGNFTADIKNLQYPLMLKAVGSNSYYSTTYDASYTNVTPFTTLALSALLGTHPENIYANFSAAVLKTPSELNLAAFSVAQKFNALIGLSNINFFHYKFVAQAGDSYDDLLEALKADLTSSGKTLTQVANEIIVENNPSPGCPSGQHLESGACVDSIRSCPINNGIGEQVYVTNYWTACQVVSCNPNYTQSGSLCLPSSRECQAFPSHATEGTETWGGTSWNVCQISSCEAGYELDNNSCVNQSVTPPSANLTITETNMAKAYLDLRSINLGTKSLFLTHQNDVQDGYILDSTSSLKTFIDPTPSVYGYFSDGTLLGNDLYYLLSETQVFGKFSIYKVDSTTGGTSSAIELNSSVAGYNSPSRSSIHSMNGNIYYRAQQDTSALSGTGIYKYNPNTGVASKIVSNVSTYATVLKEKVASENLVIFHRASDVTPNKYIFSAIGADDQLVTLRELLMSEYICLSGQLSPFNDCAPVYLEGRVLIQFRTVSGDNYRMLVTDGTIAGTSLIDIPYHLGGMGNVTVFQNKIIFSALSKANIYEGTKIYGYSHAEGFHFVSDILSSGDAPSSVAVVGITADSLGAYVILKKTDMVFVPPSSFVITVTAKVLKTQGTSATTSVLINSASQEFIDLMGANIYNRGPFIAIKGHLVFTSSNQSNDSNSPVALKSLKLSDQSISTLKTDFVGHSMQYKKDPNSEKIIVSENVTNVNNSPAKILIVE